MLLPNAAVAGIALSIPFGLIFAIIAAAHGLKKIAYGFIFTAIAALAFLMIARYL